MSNDSIYIVIGLILIGITALSMWAIEEFKKEDKE